MFSKLRKKITRENWLTKLLRQKRYSLFENVRLREKIDSLREKTIEHLPIGRKIAQYSDINIKLSFDRSRWQWKLNRCHYVNLIKMLICWNVVEITKYWFYLLNCSNDHDSFVVKVDPNLVDFRQQHCNFWDCHAVYFKNRFVSSINRETHCVESFRGSRLHFLRTFTVLKKHRVDSKRNS